MSRLCWGLLCWWGLLCADSSTVYHWDAPPMDPTGAPNAPLPSGPFLGNGDLGLSVGADPSAGAVHLYLGLNQMWLLNQYRHWSDNAADQIGPRRLGVGGLTLAATGLVGANFSAELDMARAEARIQLGQLRLRVLLGERTANGSALAVAIETASALDLNVTAWSLPLGSLCGRKVPPPYATPCADMDGSTKAGGSAAGPWAQRTPFGFTAKPISVATATALVGERLPAPTNCSADGLAASCVYHGVAGELTLLAAVVTNTDLCDTWAGCSNPLPVAQQTVKALAATDASAAMAAIEQPHASWWGTFWNQTSVSIANQQVQQLWDSLQFLAGSTSRPDTVAPALFGPWVFSDNPPWSGDYTLDYNYQANFWGMYPANRIDQASSFFKPLMDFVPKARRAAGYKNCSALSFPAHIAPFGFASADSGMSEGVGHGDLGYQNNGLFAGMNFILHWEHTFDTAWLKHTGFHYLRDTFALYQCLLTKQPDGSYVDLVDSDTECDGGGSQPSGLSPRCERKSFGMAIAFIKRAGSALPEMARALGMPIDPEWEEIAQRLVMPPTLHNNFSSCDNSSGKFPECDGPLTSWAFFPGELVNLADPVERRQIGINTVRSNGGFMCNNCFDMMFSAALRVGMPIEEVLQHLYALLQPCSPKQMRATADMCLLPNGVVSVPGGVEVMGALDFVTSMLMQSITLHQPAAGEVRYYTTLFPAINRSEAASFSRLRARGAFLVSASWNVTMGAVETPVVVESERGQDFVLDNPWPGLPVAVSTVAGHSVPHSLSGLRVRFATQDGQTYLVRHS